MNDIYQDQNITDYSKRAVGRFFEAIEAGQTLEEARLTAGIRAQTPALDDGAKRPRL